MENRENNRLFDVSRGISGSRGSGFFPQATEQRRSSDVWSLGELGETSSLTKSGSFAGKRNFEVTTTGGDGTSPASSLLDSDREILLKDASPTFIPSKEFNTVGKYEFTSLITSALPVLKREIYSTQEIRSRDLNDGSEASTLHPYFRAPTLTHAFSSSSLSSSNDTTSTLQDSMETNKFENHSSTNKASSLGEASNSGLQDSELNEPSSPDPSLSDAKSSTTPVTDSPSLESIDLDHMLLDMTVVSVNNLQACTHEIFDIMAIATCGRLFLMSVRGLVTYQIINVREMLVDDEAQGNINFMAERATIRHLAWHRESLLLVVAACTQLLVFKENIFLGDHGDPLEDPFLFPFVCCHSISLAYPPDHVLVFRDSLLFDAPPLQPPGPNEDPESANASCDPRTAFHFYISHFTFERREFPHVGRKLPTRNKNSEAQWGMLDFTGLQTQAFGRWRPFLPGENKPGSRTISISKITADRSCRLLGVSYKQTNDNFSKGMKLSEPSVEKKMSQDSRGQGRTTIPQYVIRIWTSNSFRVPQSCLKVFAANPLEMAIQHPDMYALADDLKFHFDEPDANNKPKSKNGLARLRLLTGNISRCFGNISCKKSSAPIYSPFKENSTDQISPTLSNCSIFSTFESEAGGSTGWLPFSHRERDLQDAYLGTKDGTSITDFLTYKDGFNVEYLAEATYTCSSLVHKAPVLNFIWLDEGRLATEEVFVPASLFSLSADNVITIWSESQLEEKYSFDAVCTISLDVDPLLALQISSFIAVDIPKRGPDHLRCGGTDAFNLGIPVEKVLRQQIPSFIILQSPRACPSYPFPYAIQALQRDQIEHSLVHLDLLAESPSTNAPVGISDKHSLSRNIPFRPLGHVSNHRLFSSANFKKKASKDQAKSSSVQPYCLSVPAFRRHCLDFLLVHFPTISGENKGLSIYVTKDLASQPFSPPTARRLLGPEHLPMPCKVQRLISAEKMPSSPLADVCWNESREFVVQQGGLFGKPILVKDGILFPSCHLLLKTQTSEILLLMIRPQIIDKQPRPAPSSEHEKTPQNFHQLYVRYNVKVMNSRNFPAPLYGYYRFKPPNENCEPGVEQSNIQVSNSGQTLISHPKPVPLFCNSWRQVLRGHVNDQCISLLTDSGLCMIRTYGDTDFSHFPGCEEAATQPNKFFDRIDALIHRNAVSMSSPYIDSSTSNTPTKGPCVPICVQSFTPVENPPIFHHISWLPLESHIPVIIGVLPGATSLVFFEASNVVGADTFAFLPVVVEGPESAFTVQERVVRPKDPDFALCQILSSCLSSSTAVVLFFLRSKKENLFIRVDATINTLATSGVYLEPFVQFQEERSYRTKIVNQEISLACCSKGGQTAGGPVMTISPPLLIENRKTKDRIHLMSLLWLEKNKEMQYVCDIQLPADVYPKNYGGYRKFHSLVAMDMSNDVMVVLTNKAFIYIYELLSIAFEEEKTIYHVKKLDFSGVIPRLTVEYEKKSVDLKKSVAYSFGLMRPQAESIDKTGLKHSSLPNIRSNNATLPYEKDQTHDKFEDENHNSRESKYLGYSSEIEIGTDEDDRLCLLSNLRLDDSDDLFSLSTAFKSQLLPTWKFVPNNNAVTMLPVRIARCIFVRRLWDFSNSSFQWTPIVYGPESTSDGLSEFLPPNFIIERLSWISPAGGFGASKGLVWMSFLITKYVEAIEGPKFPVAMKVPFGPAYESQAEGDQIGISKVPDLDTSSGTLGVFFPKFLWHLILSGELQLALDILIRLTKFLAVIEPQQSDFYEAIYQIRIPPLLGLPFEAFLHPKKHPFAYLQASPHVEESRNFSAEPAGAALFEELEDDFSFQLDLSTNLSSDDSLSDKFHSERETQSDSDCLPEKISTQNKLNEDENGQPDDTTVFTTLCSLDKFLEKIIKNEANEKIDLSGLFLEDLCMLRYINSNVAILMQNQNWNYSSPPEEFPENTINLFSFITQLWNSPPASQMPSLSQMKNNLTSDASVEILSGVYIGSLRMLTVQDKTADFMPGRAIPSPWETRTFKLSSPLVAYAYHTPIPETLLNKCCDLMTNFSPHLIWEDFRQLGVGYWLTDFQLLSSVALRITNGTYARFDAWKRRWEENSARSVDEEAIRHEIEEQEKALIDRVALFFVLLNRIVSLETILNKNKENSQFADFLSRDFSDPENQNLCLKNAYNLIKKKRHLLAAAFFVLGGQTRDAIDVALRHLEDPQLAIVIAVLHDLSRSSYSGKTRHTICEEILRDKILPIMFASNDKILISVILSRLNMPGVSYYALLPASFSFELSRDAIVCHTAKKLLKAFLELRKKSLIHVFVGTEIHQNSPYTSSIRLHVEKSPFIQAMKISLPKEVPEDSPEETPKENSDEGHFELLRHSEKEILKILPFILQEMETTLRIHESYRNIAYHLSSSRFALGAMNDVAALKASNPLVSLPPLHRKLLINEALFLLFKEYSILNESSAYRNQTDISGSLKDIEKTKVLLYTNLGSHTYDIESSVQLRILTQTRNWVWETREDAVPNLQKLVVYRMSFLSQKGIISKLLQQFIDLMGLVSIILSNPLSSFLEPQTFSTKLTKIYPFVLVSYNEWLRIPSDETNYKFCLGIPLVCLMCACLIASSLLAVSEILTSPGIHPSLVTVPVINTPNYRQEGEGCFSKLLSDDVARQIEVRQRTLCQWLQEFCASLERLNGVADSLRSKFDPEMGKNQVPKNGEIPADLIAGLFESSMTAWRLLCRTEDSKDKLNQTIKEYRSHYNFEATEHSSVVLTSNVKKVEVAEGWRRLVLSKGKDTSPDAASEEPSQEQTKKLLKEAERDFYRSCGSVIILSILSQIAYAVNNTRSVLKITANAYQVFDPITTDLNKRIKLKTDSGIRDCPPVSPAINTISHLSALSCRLNVFIEFHVRNVTLSIVLFSAATTLPFLPSLFLNAYGPSESENTTEKEKEEEASDLPTLREFVDYLTENILKLPLSVLWKQLSGPETFNVMFSRTSSLESTRIPGQLFFRNYLPSSFITDFIRMKKPLAPNQITLYSSNNLLYSFSVDKCLYNPLSQAYSAEYLTTSRIHPGLGNILVSGSQGSFEISLLEGIISETSESISLRKYEQAFSNMLSNISSFTGNQQLTGKVKTRSEPNAPEFSLEVPFETLTRGLSCPLIPVHSSLRDPSSHCVAAMDIFFRSGLSPSLGMTLHDSDPNDTEFLLSSSSKWLYVLCHLLHKQIRTSLVQIQCIDSQSQRLLQISPSDNQHDNNVQEKGVLENTDLVSKLPSFHLHLNSLSSNILLPHPWLPISLVLVSQGACVAETATACHQGLASAIVAVVRRVGVKNIAPLRAFALSPTDSEGGGSATQPESVDINSPNLSPFSYASQGITTQIAGPVCSVEWNFVGNKLMMTFARKK
eukprot:GHVP01014394.1.p1 GENE.GHVP01014394.1~~GHVP01014394.1.p1  ORF type:complete len:3373 (-),score=545.34 GHVP01014394.1:957-11075(-)